MLDEGLTRSSFDNSNYNNWNNNSNVSSHLWQQIKEIWYKPQLLLKKFIITTKALVAIKAKTTYVPKAMKRKSNLYHQVYDIDNLRLAEKKARKGKAHQKGVIEYDKDKENNLIKLHYLLRTKTYKTSEYKRFQIKEEKVRDISSLPFFPDRICHHALMIILDPILIPTFTVNTFNCIKGRGLHKASFAVRNALKDVQNTTYYLKIDVKKFYPSINNEILKSLLRRKIKDVDLLWLLDEIIDSHIGLPLGNYPSQNLANFYLSSFDHWLKEECKVKYVYRYCDDIVILHSSKEYLHDLLLKIKKYLNENLKLTVKSNYQVSPVASRMIDFVGYPVDHNNVKLRPKIKKRMMRMFKKNCNSKSAAAYGGWLKHCNSKHLQKKIEQCK